MILSEMFLFLIEASWSKVYARCIFYLIFGGCFIPFGVLGINYVVSSFVLVGAILIVALPLNVFLIYITDGGTILYYLIG